MLSLRRVVVVVVVVVGRRYSCCTVVAIDSCIGIIDSIHFLIENLLRLLLSIIGKSRANTAATTTHLQQSHGRHASVALDNFCNKVGSVREGMCGWQLPCRRDEGDKQRGVEKEKDDGRGKSSL